MLTRRMFLSGLAIGIASASGCGKRSNRVPVHPVKGRIVHGSTPIAHATVVFHPLDETTAEIPKPHGKTADDGSFSLTTYDGNDGAPAGRYRVTVELWLTPGGDAAPVNTLPPAYAVPTTSGLTANVDRGDNDIPAFDLSI